MISGSNLFVKNLNPIGDQNCHFCGTKCKAKEENNINVYIKDIFSGRDIVYYPSSQYVCDGCVTVCQNKMEFTTCIGEIVNTMPRMFSWVITKDSNVAYSKAHIQKLRAVVLNPPEPPFSIVIAVSGQKQLLFRSIVSEQKDNFPILFEDTVVYIELDMFNYALDLATNVSASIGKMALRDEPSYASGIRYFESYNNMNKYLEWFENYQRPLFQVAAFFCEPKELCLIKMKGLINEKIK